MPRFTPRFCISCGGPLQARKGDDPLDDPDRERLRCVAEDCGWSHYDNPTPVVAAIVRQGDDVLLVRNATWPAAWFGLVTGFLERGEAPDDAALREVKEELGLDARLGEWVGVYPFFPMNQVILVWQVEVPVGSEPTLSAELAAFKRVSIERLEPWPFATGDAVRDWLARVRS